MQAVSFGTLMLLLPPLAAAAAAAYDGYVPGFRFDPVYVPPACSRRSQDGDLLKKHYTGRLQDGTKFDSSYDRGKTFDFRLGMSEVIRGMDLGMQGMCVGEKRKITIPAELAYGDRGVPGKIPPGATLQFDVELVELVPSGFQSSVLYRPDDKQCRRVTRSGDRIREHYNGTFLDGRKFDSSHDRGETYNFTLGKKQVIRGVDMGLMNMCVGERRLLVIPPALAYGEKGYANLIPPGSTLVFEVELIDIEGGTLKWYKIDGPDCDRQTQRGDFVKVHYHGFLDTNTKFESTYATGKTYDFKIGDPNVIEGLNAGVLNMCVGERRRLKIPPEYAYGSKGTDKVPPNVGLIMDVELRDVDVPDAFKIADANHDHWISEDEYKAYVKTTDEFSKLDPNSEAFSKAFAEKWQQKDRDKNSYLCRHEFFNTKETHHDEL